jgi:hypothetical protein
MLEDHPYQCNSMKDHALRCLKCNYLVYFKTSRTPLIDILWHEIQNQIESYEKYDKFVNDKSTNDYTEGYIDCLKTFHSLCKELFFAPVPIDQMSKTLKLKDEQKNNFNPINDYQVKNVDYVKP